MIIGIDANEANGSERVGVHQYAYEILWSFYRINKKKPKNKFTLYIKNNPSEDLPPENEWWNYKILPSRGMWILTRLMPHLIFNKDCDIFFSPSHYIPPILRVPAVFTIHDLGYLDFSVQFKKYDFWQLKYWTAISIIVSKGIIAVSQSAKKNIVRQYKVSEEKVKVAYHGFDKTRFNSKISDMNVRRVENKYKLPQNYILSIGTLKPSKNLEGLIEGFSILNSKNPKLLKNWKLVVAGKKGWLYEKIFTKSKKLNIEDKIVFTDFVDEKDKPALLAGAYVLVSPSFWEGFGMQVLEANACGTPVIISNVASLPEVGGKSALYVDPRDTLSIADSIERVLTMTKKEYNRLVKESIKQSSKFSWEKSGKITLELFRKVYSKNVQR